MHLLPGIVLALLKGKLCPDGGHRDGYSHDEGAHQLHGGGGHIEAQGHGHDKAIQAAAKHHAQHPAHHGALAHQRFADDKGSQCNGHHAGAHVDVAALLVLGQQAAGKGGQRARDAQAHCDGEGRVDAGGPHHGGVVAGGADGKAQPGAQETHHGGTGEYNDRRRDDQLIPAARKGQCGFCQREYRIGLDQGHRGRKAHDRQIDGVQAGVHDDACHDALNAQTCLQKGGDKARTHTRRHGREQGQNGVARQRHLAGHGTAKGEAAIGGQVGNVQDRIAQKQRQRHQTVNAAQLQRRLDHVERKDTRQHG